MIVHRDRQETDHERRHRNATPLDRARQHHEIERVAEQAEPHQRPPFARAQSRHQPLPARREQDRGKQAVSEVAARRELQRGEGAHQYRRQEDEPPQGPCPDTACDARNDLALSAHTLSAHAP
jgi:hypothetical protein